MGVFLAVFGIMLVVVLAMSVGFIAQRKTISGSCGGISALGMDKACDCKDPCDERKAKIAAEEKAAAKRAAKEKLWQDNRIDS
ncbi:MULTISPECIES: (Na+)-NQR maturation NqrM [Idiomarina]|uniref:(Na+)-NQR maturation NqrM n=1 Tax=Idiomarina TaxID=135575 RepID=UPI00129B903E|nr:MULTISPECIES: (Na+)-NQR maturation NqrM [Idiomarina]MDX1524646.1 (Na+)-NQR maturation NqrM [Pseudidiomarina maritima]MRJ41140.1 (Na+)-NQR maturation NqrM [Idiomarina sp. FeN1]NCU56305.1 (Na+)-NQR maturation NqrM [Idiomarina sp. FenA--70]NCU59324.1 (Na+)-NQR maturation NqrM [Idiomarina sp. FenBw--71]UUN12500.1 (Na+)-NQR maturation NqrM [Idiomarina loihiensis]